MNVTSSILLLFISFCTVGCAAVNESSPNDLAEVGATHATLALTPVLQLRCGQYATSLPGKLVCDSTALTFMTSLDFGPPRGKPIIEKNDGEVRINGLSAFRAALREEVRSGRAEKFLSQLRKRLEADQGQLSLWSLALDASQGDRRDALKNLALLFQDRDAQMHVRYLKTVFGDDNRVALLISYLTQLLIENQDRIDFYPPGISTTNKLWYHFYVPAYNALLIHKDQSNHRMSAFMAYLFNAEYELQDHLTEVIQDSRKENDKRQQQGFLQKVGRLVDTLNEAKVRLMGSWGNIDLKKMEPTLRDLHLGYAGGQWAVVSQSSKILSEAEFIERFSHNPSVFQRSMFDSCFGH